MPTAISIRNLTKSFGPGGPAVDNISLDINPGELFFLLGPSGCGKTTLLRMVAGFIDPTAGQILVSSATNDSRLPTPDSFRDITHTPPNRRNTGMVFQSYALWPHMTVEQNVAFGLQLRKVPAADQSRRIAEALALVHMQDLAKRKPNQLSGGQQQRVALARALVIRPDVLLLDEPLSNLDAKLRTELRSEIRRICKTGGNAQGASPSPITTVYVTHDQKEALSMADRMAVLNKGRIVALGTPRDLYRNPPSTFVAAFLGETNFIPIESIAKAQSPGLSSLTSPAGPLVTSHTIPSAPKLTASIRPEAFHIHDAQPYLPT
jgi:iron(III) transport system ATP-binding protein